MHNSSLSVINYDDDYGPPWGSPGAANGVLMQDGWITESFNALNQPLNIWSWRTVQSGNNIGFFHDPLGRCVKRTNDGGVNTYLYYDGWNLIQEGPNSASADRIYAHGNRVDEVVADQYGGAWAYHHYDARGHCILLTDASGNIIEQYDYDAFGKPYFYNASGTLLTSSGWGNRFLFSGREWLNNVAVYDFRNRHYLPELGRFIQPDPKEFEAGDYNLYRYCHNDPVNKVDPDGLVDLSYTPSGENGLEWERSYTPSGKFTVAGHMNQQFVAGPDGKPLTTLQVAKDMLAKGYMPGKDVEMLGCESAKGNKSVAERLAQTLTKLTGVKTTVTGSTTETQSNTQRGQPVVVLPDKSGKPGEMRSFTKEPPKDVRRTKTKE